MSIATTVVLILLGCLPVSNPMDADFKVLLIESDVFSKNIVRLAEFVDAVHHEAQAP